jgi:glycosyltransferase involved in cell wall biosynthesis
MDHLQLPRIQSAVYAKATSMDGNHSQETSQNTGPEVIDLSDYRIDVIIPAFNEERFIGSVVLKLQQYPVSIIVVDDGSTDDTALIAQLAGATVIQHETNRGKGQALNTGFEAVRQLAPDAIVTIDADGQHLPAQLSLVVEPILAGRADIVIGSRYLQTNCKVPPLRRWGHGFFNLLNRGMTGVSSTDSQSGYRAFSPKAFQADIFHSSGFTVESEMQFLAHEFDLKVLEVGIAVNYSDKPKRSVWTQGLIVLGGILRLAGQYRPLLFFGLTGVILTSLGVIGGLWVVDRFGKVKQLATGTALISVMLVVSGLTFFSTGIILHSVRGLIYELYQREKK